MDPPYSAPGPLPLPYPPHHHHLFLCPHHHHHHHHVIICPHHHNHPMPHHHHCLRFNTNCEGHIPPPLQNQSTSETNPCLPLETQFCSSTQTLQEPEHVELEEEEEEDEPVFVLTDEWRDFFAKSEAKRKLEKQQAKKNRRKLIRAKADSEAEASPSLDFSDP
ncbi:hypothetical protein HS088_TW10G00286 [Tripterygium wilfordii]|uniref:SKI/DACH domain-containing protein 1-like n=1 Tax=Tripterygium wilfordii TaxID=458696 RepID=A0A7J7D4M4_TRIWF|nr:SKI/DACH domain-containing protein 1-like [Tripterygium wilfordii]KAF5741290.1 hypothetical protein HS088_TW10G00286 [Tripterygium wilfordii]